jgi:hypothetical protein
MPAPAVTDDVLELVRRTTAAQGLAERVTDPSTLARIAAMIPAQAGTPSPAKATTRRKRTPREDVVSPSSTATRQGDLDDRPTARPRQATAATRP